MNFLKPTLVILLSTICLVLNAQNAVIYGNVKINEVAQEGVQVEIDELNVNTKTDSQGVYRFEQLPIGTYTLTVSPENFEEIQKLVLVEELSNDIEVDFEFSDTLMQLDDFVVTGTKTPKRKTNSPVIVNVLNSKTLDNVQACNLSEGLRFQPGLRVETDCQTCNYTQLRMNGLAGGYAQILINGRPIFSPLTGLYGMEQIPTNMIEKIEVVRGGGSSLYGSSAIGGTVNVITKIPQNNDYEVDYSYQNISGTNDHNLSGNATIVSENKNSGISFFMNRRERDFYDANGDHFSEIPMVKNTAIGTNMYFLPNDNQKLEFNLSYVDEYRFGGEMVPEKPAYLAKQSEERTHNVWMSSLDYQINFNNDNSSIIAYAAWQNTDRKHYTGIMPDEGTVELEEFLANPPYGTSDVSTYNVGAQLNHKLTNFLNSVNTFTLGLEYVTDEVMDEIPAYNYLVDQTTNDLGVFVQSDWAITPSLTLLSGVRMDKHNLLDDVVLSPRASLLYKYEDNTQFRVSYGTGFRAPQAFDADLHIAFAGGGVSRVLFSPDLKQEKSQSFSASINYDKPMEEWIAGFTLEGFHNRLNDAFYLQPIGEDNFGELFEKQNGDGATVQGLTLELRANYNKVVQFEGGFTLQKSEFDTPVSYIEGVEAINEFTRTPNDYGYGIITFTPNNQWNATLNYVYTGEMIMPHFAGAPNQLVDEMFTSKAFSEFSSKIGYTFPMESLATNIEIYGGVKNIFDAYQDNFDIGKNRDSNFIYGPANPRTYFIGIKFKSE